MKKFPIGLQSFAGLREDHYYYIDKTAYIYKLVNTGKQFFMSRPRRFGKSLLLSTMHAYWEGKKELFQGLDIELLKEKNADAWQTYPVLYFDFNGQNYQSDLTLDDVLDLHLSRWEKQYDIMPTAASLSGRFQDLLVGVHQKTGQRVVVLVDEYDKPLLETLDHPEREEHNKAVFKGFFSNLKSYDEHLQFVFITGVTKFNKVSIFSDLNQLNDISLDVEFAGICGITEEELQQQFEEPIAHVAQEMGISAEECIIRLRKTYDGYRFSRALQERVYNPFSLLCALQKRNLGYYWFETGTPTFLVRRLMRDRFDVRKFTDQSLFAGDSALSDYRADNPDLVPLLYQTGYLTVMDYDSSARVYTLGFPNEEVKYGFLNNLMPEYVGNCGAGSGKDIYTLQRYIKQGKTEEIRDVLTALFASIPYTLQEAPFEHYFQTVLYITFTLLGQFVQCELHTFKGRIDCVVETPEYIYVFELKRDDTAEHALSQIEDKSYSLPYAADHRTLFKIGVSFDSESRMLNGWIVETEQKI